VRHARKVEDHGGLELQEGTLDPFLIEEVNGEPPDSVIL
jgi:hypothetical protein